VAGGADIKSVYGVDINCNCHELFNKYNRINIPLTIVIFIVGSFLFYFLLQKIIRQLDETLRRNAKYLLCRISSSIARYSEYP
jgi:hypothetical protein